MKNRKVENNMRLFKNKGNEIERLIDFSLLFFLLAKTGFLKTTYLEYISLLLFILLNLYKFFKNKKMRMTYQVICYTLFGIYACFSYFWALDGTTAMKVIPSILGVIALLFSLSLYVDSKQNFIKLIRFVVFANFLSSFKIILLYFLYTGSAADRISNITGIYFNTVGQVIGFAIILTFYLYKLYNKKLYLGMVVIQFIAVLLTESRKSILIPLLALGIVILLQKKTFKQLLRYLLLVFSLGIFSAIIYFTDFSFTKDIKDKFQGLFMYATGQKTDDWSINLRQFFIDTGIEIYRDNKLVGIGVNNFSYYVGHYTEYGKERYSHNNYIEILSCLGIVGMILYYWIYIYLLLNLFKNVIKDRQNLLLIILLSLLVVLMIMEWGIVSYTGCMYHIFIAIICFGCFYKNDLYLKENDVDVK